MLSSFETNDESKENHIKYRSTDNGVCLFIEPNDPYLDAIRNGDVINPLHYHWSPWQWRFDFPALDVKLVNNTDETIYFHEALFRVARSRLYPTPVPVIRGTSYNMTMTLENVGWGEMQDSVLRFSLDPWSDDDTSTLPDVSPFELPIGTISEEPRTVSLDDFSAKAVLISR